MLVLAQSAFACKHNFCDFAAVVESCQSVADQPKKIWETIRESYGREQRWEWSQIEHNFEASESLILALRVTAQRDRDLLTDRRKTWQEPDRKYRFLRLTKEGASCELFIEGDEILYQIRRVHCDNVPPNEPKVYWREECLLLVSDIKRIHSAKTPDELKLWERVGLSWNAVDYHEYLRRFPDGAYASAARERASGLEHAQSQHESSSKFESTEQALATGHEPSAQLYKQWGFAQDLEAQVRIGHLYLEGDGVAPDEFEAFYWFYQAARAGDPEGQTMVGRLTLKGRGTEFDREKAIEWLNVAVDQGHGPAMAVLGKYLRNGYIQDQPRAMELLNRAGETGNAEAQYELARHYKSTGPDKDVGRALSLMHSAAEAGFAPAQADLARRYYIGNGVKIDARTAEKWARKAAHQGNRDGLRMLGIHYYYGVVVKQDVARARELLEQAAAKGDRVAKQSLKQWDSRDN